MKLKRSLSRLGLCAAGVSLVALTSCAVAPELAGDPHDAGLVVVDGTFYNLAVVGEEQATITDATLSNGRLEVQGRAYEGHMVFPNLEPGRYFVASVGAVVMTRVLVGRRDRTQRYLLTLPITPQLRERIPGLTFQVEPGRALYAGALRVFLRIRSFEKPEIDRAELVKSAETERDVWQTFAAEEAYRISPWLRQIQARLAELNR